MFSCFRPLFLYLCVDPPRVGGDAGVYFRSLFASEPFEGKIAGVCRKTGNSHQGNAFNVTADVTGHGGSLLYAGPLAILPFLHAQVLVEELLKHVRLQHRRVTPQRLQQFHVSVPEKKMACYDCKR